MSEDPIISVRNLKKHYPITEGLMKREVGRIKAVDGISFDLYPGETLGLVGESGCGKSTAATTLLRLEEPTAGTVLFNGDDITTYDDEELKRFRRRAQLIYQDPTSSFDPRMTVGESITEPLVIHGIRDRDRRRAIAQDLLKRVGLTAGDVDRYPHEFSGGQKQRIAFARALVVNPEFVIADEPISALDVSVQAELLALMDAIQDEFGLSILFISHDMSVVREVCDRVGVMYLGEIVELGPTDTVFSDPQHPYTRALLSSIPNPNPRERGQAVELSGDVPDPSAPPPGCRFHTRCPEVIQPPEYNMTNAEWRGVMDLRVRLRDQGITIEAVKEFIDIEETPTGESTTREMTQAIRNEFDLPDRLSDNKAESVLSTALDAITNGDELTARDTLAEAFTTPCETDDPEFHETAVGHNAACHLHDHRFADVPDAPSSSGITDD